VIAAALLASAGNRSGAAAAWQRWPEAATKVLFAAPN